MSAPLATTRPLSVADPHLCYLSPASTIASDFNYPSPVMPSLQSDFNDNGGNPRRTSQSRSPKAASPAGTGANFTFITTTNPKQMKSKKVMTIVRKTAMGHYLEHEKDKKDSKSNRTRLNSETSEASHGSLNDVEPSTRPGATRRKSSQKKQTTSVEASASMSNSNHQQAPGRQIIRSPIPGERVFESETLFIPMGPIEQRVFDQSQVPLLRSIGRALDPFRTMFQSANPRVSTEQLKFECSQYFGTVGLGRLWIPTCVQRAHSFLSTLFLAAVYHDILNKHEVESLETTALRQDIIAMVGKDFLHPGRSVDDHNIIAVSQLIIGEVMARNETSLAYHEKGMERMIEYRGIENVGLNGRIASAVSWVNLTSAILREARPRPMYHDYIKKHTVRSYPSTAMVPESPIYRPRDKFYTLEKSGQCGEKTLALLNDMRTMIDFFLLETSGNRRNSGTLVNLYKDITTKYASVTKLMRTNVLTPRDWKYEAIRITAVVLATAMFKRIPLSAALHEATSTPKMSSSFYTSSTASQSNESLFSTAETQQVSPLTEYSASPTFNIHDPITGRPGIPFDTPIVDFDPHRFSISTQASASRRPSQSSSHRPSLVSMQSLSLSSIPSTSSDMLYFPGSSYAGAGASAHNSQGTLLKDLREALEKSNLSRAWEDMAGVLLWIGLVMGAASHGHKDKCLARYFSATALRAGIMLCFEHPEAIHSTVLTMTDVMEALCGFDSEQGTTNTSITKRRRQMTPPEYTKTAN